MRESKQAKKQRAQEFCARIHAHYAHAESALNYTDAFTLTIAVLLSAQTTDAAVNKVTPTLFSRWGTPQLMAQARVDEVGEVIRSIGFWRTKAEHCVQTAQMIISDFGGSVPHTMKELTRLPGVGRKTANIVMNKAFSQAEGIAVDTHVFRIAKRLGFSRAQTPLAAEQDLLQLLPRQTWEYVNEEWIHFGREICPARKPHCDKCFACDICPSSQLEQIQK